MGLFDQIASTVITSQTPFSVKNTRMSSPLHTQVGKGVYFMLYENGRFTGIPKAKFVFPINPEDFNISRPDRVNVVQTLGDPFVDEFGKGLTSVNIRGTTGWRSRMGNLDMVDGYEAYRRLHRDIVDSYFDLRSSRLAMGQDPDTVRLILVNGVDDLIYDVVPQEFRLLRSRSRPMLYQYDMNMIAIDDLSSLSRQFGLMDGLSFLGDWMDKMIGRLPILGDALSWFKDNVIEPLGGVYANVKEFLAPVFETAATLWNGAKEIMGDLQVGAAAVAWIINDVADKCNYALGVISGTALFWDTLTLPVRVAVSYLRSTFNEVGCYIKNGFSHLWGPDFAPLYGVSDCGSSLGVTSGEYANSTDINTIEWSSAVYDAITTQGLYSNVIAVRKSDSSILPEIVQPGDAPVTIRDDIGIKTLQLSNDVQEIVDAQDIVMCFRLMADILGSIAFDPSKLSLANTPPVVKHLIPIDRVTKIVVQEGESLQSIALRELGDASRWVEIAAINNIIIESPIRVWLPVVSFTVNTILSSGTDYINYPGVIPDGYFEADSLIRVIDSNNDEQSIQVKETVGSQVTFYGTFSRMLIGPLKITQYKNRAKVRGIYDSSVTITVDVASGSRRAYVSQSKDIYPGYTLYLKAEEYSEDLVVDQVNYLEGYVDFLTATHQGYGAGTEINIYNTETHLCHLDVGTSLQIPAIGNVASQQLIRSSDELFGSDMTLTKDGDISIDNGDFGIISGLENLKQAIDHRLRSPYQSIIIHPSYGCGIYSILGEKNTQFFDTLVRATLIDAIGNEPRIKDLTNVDSETDGDTIRVSMRLRPTDTNTDTDYNFVLGVV